MSCFNFFLEKPIMCSKIKSSFNGKITEIPGIAVDNFEKHSLKSQAYFLSHCHSDHTKGLFTPDLLDTLKHHEIRIYTSELSRAIIEDDCNNDKVLMDHIVPLESGSCDITLPKVFGHEEVSLRVTVISAGHCLGSIMFLFETYDKKTVLYTGDFNISSNDLTHIRPFRDENKDPIKIDVIYVDTTFIGIEYEYFPKRTIVMNEMIQYIDKWLKTSANNRVALSTSAKYGYEYVFHQIFTRLQFKVLVADERLEFYSKHPTLMTSITNKQDETRIHLCRDISEKGNHKLCSISKTPAHEYLFIRLSAMKWSGYRLEESAINKIKNNRLDVCFPTHCSRTEIINFVNYFSPKKIVGFPNKYVTDHENKRQWSSEKKEPTNKRRKALESPKKNCNKKLDKDLLKLIFD